MYNDTIALDEALAFLNEETSPIMSLVDLIRESDEAFAEFTDVLNEAEEGGSEAEEATKGKFKQFIEKLVEFFKHIRMHIRAFFSKLRITAKAIKGFGSNPIGNLYAYAVSVKPDSKFGKNINDAIKYVASANIDTEYEFADLKDRNVLEADKLNDINTFAYASETLNKYANFSFLSSLLVQQNLGYGERYKGLNLDIASIITDAFPNYDRCKKLVQDAVDKSEAHNIATKKYKLSEYAAENEALGKAIKAVGNKYTDLMNIEHEIDLNLKDVESVLSKVSKSKDLDVDRIKVFKAAIALYKDLMLAVTKEMTYTMANWNALKKSTYTLVRACLKEYKKKDKKEDSKDSK